jgi:hypothetical protein
MKFPKLLFHKNGEKYHFEKVLNKDKGMFLYQLDHPSLNVQVVLTPKKIEKEFQNRPHPQSSLKQGYFECAVASIAMLTHLSLEQVRRACKKFNWVEGQGLSRDQIKKVLNSLGYSSMVSSFCPHEPCIFSVESLNLPNAFHCLYFDGKQIIDPQYGNLKVYWYATDWSPEAIGGFDFITISRRNTF